MSTTRGNSYRRAAGPANSNGPRPAAAAAAPVKLRKPVFTTVDLIKPTMQGINLTARVLSARTILDKTLPDRRIQVSECLVGDGTGTILFTARNLQVDKVKPGTTVIFRNARIDMFKDTMRLAVDKWGLIEVIENPVWFGVNEDNNVSEVEYELVNVPPEKVNAPGKREKANMPAEERY